MAVRLGLPDLRSLLSDKVSVDGLGVALLKLAAMSAEGKLEDKDRTLEPPPEGLSPLNGENIDHVVLAGTWWADQFPGPRALLHQEGPSYMSLHAEVPSSPCRPHPHPAEWPCSTGPANSWRLLAINAPR